MELTTETASWLAQLPMRCICREYPNKLDQVLSGPEDLKSPRELHPAFYGCFDWHSAVHGHWMLVKLLKLFELPEAREIRAMLDQNLSEANLQAEAKFFGRPNTQSFERPYGWGWLLKLAEELGDWDDPDGKRWLDALLPLANTVVARYESFFPTQTYLPLTNTVTIRYGAYFPTQTYPVRAGTHANTAFGLAFAWDFCSAQRVAVGGLVPMSGWVIGDDKARRYEPTDGYPCGAGDLLALVESTARAYYLGDKKHSPTWEPGGSDFLSPCLVEADLMRRVLPADQFQAWFHDFLPDLPNETTLLNPAKVADRSDPQIGHLDGLNISRAWSMEGIAEALPDDDPYKQILTTAAKKHRDEGLAHIATGDYLGEHWLASFAVYLLTRRSNPTSRVE